MSKCRHGLLIFALIFVSASAHAMLGGAADSIESDRKNLNLNRGESKSLKSYRIEELTSDNIKIRQFVSKDGVVFGIAWSGRVGAQLPQLLGTYASDYQTQQAQHPPTRAGRIPYRKVEAGRVVLEYWDLLRRVRGKAYVPTLVPADVTASQIFAN